MVPLDINTYTHSHRRHTYTLSILSPLVNLIFFIMLAVDEDARGWHDHLASTKVVMG